MKAFLVVLSIVACVRADAPPLPYAAAAAAAAAASSSSYPSGYPNQVDDHEQAASGYAHQYSPAPEGFQIQSGYEGYLVPTASQNAVLVPFRDGLEYLTHLGHSGGLSRLLKLVSGKAILRIIPKVLLTAVAVVGVFILGCAVTTAVCTFTPFCSISFLGWGSVSRESMRSFLTEDRISATAAFVTEAIRKYQELYGTDVRRNQKENEAKN